MMDDDIDMLEFEEQLQKDSTNNENDKQIEEDQIQDNRGEERQEGLNLFLATLSSGFHKPKLENTFGISPEDTDFEMNMNENENMEFVQYEESNEQEVDGSGDTLMDENKLEFEEKVEVQVEVVEDENIEDEVGEEEDLPPLLESFGTLSELLKPNKDILDLIQMVTPRIIEVIPKLNISSQSQVPIPQSFEVIEFQTLVYRKGSHYFVKIKDSNEKFWHVRLWKEICEDPILRCLALKNNIFDTFDYSENDLIDSGLY